MLLEEPLSRDRSNEGSLSAEVTVESAHISSAITTPYAVAWLVFGTIAVLLNATVLFVGVRLLRKSSRSIKTSHAFILNYTIASLMLTATSPWFFYCSEVACGDRDVLLVALDCVYWLLVPVSNFFLLLINFDKAIYFLWPLRYAALMSRSAVIVLSISALAGGLIVLVCNIVAPEVDDSHPQSVTYWLTQNMFTLFVPLSLSFVLSTAMFVLVLSKTSGHRSCALFLLERRTSTSSEASIMARQRRSWRRQSKAVVFIFATSTWTLLCRMPHFCLCLYAAWGNSDIVSEHAWQIVIFFVFFEHLGNPIITLFVNVLYRKEFLQLLRNPSGSRNQNEAAEWV